MILPNRRCNLILLFQGLQTALVMSFASVNDPADVAPALPSSAPKAEEPTKMKYKSYK